VISLD
jgi:hypothetical protein